MTELPGQRFGSVPPEEMTEAYQRAAAAIAARPPASTNGLRGPTLAMLWSPDLADAIQRVGEKLMFESVVPTRHLELAILVTARRWTAQFEWWAHRVKAIEAGVAPATADAIAAGDAPDLDADGAAVYNFATQLLNDGAVSDGVWDAVVERWKKQGAMELLCTLGFYTMAAFVLNVDRYPVPGVPPLKVLPST
jgi:4-carboxymuconolactone decarboxylase